MAFIISAGHLPLQAQESFYPPLLDGKPDFEGLRFIVRDEEGIGRGYHPNVMLHGFILKREGPPVDDPVLGSKRYYLARDRNVLNEGKEEGKKDKDNDTLIQYVRTLNDLQGFVRIRTEKDALEFVRFGSSLIGYQLFDPKIEEIYCLVDTSLLPDPKRDIPPNINWSTLDDCQRLNLSPPKILNPLTRKERSELSEGADEGEAHSTDGAKSRKRRKAKKFFLIERTVIASLRSSLLRPGEVKVLRITEEVGSDGQWRVVATQEIPLSDEDFSKIRFR